MSIFQKSSDNPIRISVVIPAYNRVDMLNRAVTSVLRQTTSSFEFVVVDDGSAEDLSNVEIVLDQAGHRLLRKEHGGVASARNYGVAHTTGTWIAFLDSDDEWLPEKLQKQIEFHMRHPAYQISQTDELWIRNGTVLNKKKYHRLADGESFALCCERCAISPSSVMIKRDLYQKLGGFNENLQVCEDYEMWLRVSARHPIGLIPEKLIRKYGGHANQLSRSLPALDAFRLKGLLLLGAADVLTANQRRVLLDAIDKKAQILLTGATKRKRRWDEDFEQIQLCVERLRFRGEQSLSGAAAALLPAVENICRILAQKRSTPS